jgi:hypothetical protein
MLLFAVIAKGQAWRILHSAVPKTYSTFALANMKSVISVEPVKGLVSRTRPINWTLTVSFVVQFFVDQSGESYI